MPDTKRKFVKIISTTALAISFILPLAAAGPTEEPISPTQGESLRALVTKNLTSIASKASLTGNGNDEGRSILDLFGAYIGLSLGFVGITFLVQVVHGGYMWMTAGGNEEKITKARNKIINGAIGAGVTFSAFLIAFFVLRVFTNSAGVPNSGFEETTTPTP